MAPTRATSTLEAARALSPRSRIVMLTACMPPELAAEACRCGAQAVLEKPVDLDVLVAVVTALGLPVAGCSRTPAPAAYSEVEVTVKIEVGALVCAGIIASSNRIDFKTAVVARAVIHRVGTMCAVHHIAGRDALHALALAVVPLAVGPLAAQATGGAAGPTLEDLFRYRTITGVQLSPSTRTPSAGTGSVSAPAASQVSGRRQSSGPSGSTTSPTRTDASTGS